MNEGKCLDAVGCGYSNYKDIIIKKIDRIRLSKFRTFTDRNMDLGNVITVVSGKNGTMKSTLLGLIAHPFSSPNEARDAFGNQLKTRHRDVFYLSPEKDNEQYIYYLRITTTDGITFEEPIRVYKRSKGDGNFRHRVTVGIDNKEGRGNFSLNTSYVNLKRLIPIVDTNAKIVNHEMEKSLEAFVAEGYKRVLQKEEFTRSVLVSDKSIKQTIGPNDEADYDFKSISSGEDNLGHILNKMHAFLQYKTDNHDALQGIFCIDEMEASLHPVAQINLFNFLYDWARNNHIQVVINTHSLYLIQYVIELQERLKNKEDIVLNMISTAFVSDKNYNIIKNPNYNEAYKELTLKDIDDIHDIYKVSVICEDDVAERYLKKIISKKSVSKHLDFLHGLNEEKNGNGCNGLKSLIKNGQKLLENCIVFFDPEVDLSDLTKCKSRYFLLPSKYNLPIEKEIVKYVYDLPGDDDFFSCFNKEKAAFLNEFSNCKILNLSEVKQITEASTERFKNWANLNKNNFFKYMTYYIKHNKREIEEFRKNLEECLNEIFINKGLPPISL